MRTRPAYDIGTRNRMDGQETDGLTDPQTSTIRHVFAPLNSNARKTRYFLDFADERTHQHIEMR